LEQWKRLFKNRLFRSSPPGHDEWYRNVSGNEKLQLVLGLIMPDDPDAAVVERSARVYPVAEDDKDQADIKLLKTPGQNAASIAASPPTYAKLPACINRRAC
jgi:hypothetical protein